MEKRIKEIALMLLSDLLDEVKQTELKSGDYLADIKEAATVVIDFLNKTQKYMKRNKYEQWKAERQAELKKQYGKVYLCRDCRHYMPRLGSNGHFGNCTNNGTVPTNNLACGLFQKGGEGE